MLSRLANFSSVRGVKATSFALLSRSTAPPCPHRPCARLAPPANNRVLDPADKVMPTRFIQQTPCEEKSLGTGVPRNPGKRKRIGWLRRRPWFDRQWSLNLARVTRGPSTPTFPNGTPFKLIRKFQSFAGPSWDINVGKRRKIKLSLKRGRRRLKA